MPNILRNAHGDIEVQSDTSTRYFRRADEVIGELTWHGDPYASSVGTFAWGFVERTESFEDAVRRRLEQE